MSRIHWLGAGLSSGPGIHRLAAAETALVLWNRTPEKAAALLGANREQVAIHRLEPEQLRREVSPGDVLVSMLPADWHPRIARIALDRQAHFVSSSYLSEEMRALHAEAVAAGLCLVNEVGLDPGLDHLMAHQLVSAYRDSHCPPDSLLSFRSYCGGFPAVANPFRYKFSWSPLGVLRALRTPARCIRHGAELDVARPWEAITRYQLPTPEPESFEAYPNRDSLPFVRAYDFDPRWPVAEFVRGTLRLPGWSEAWSPLFTEIGGLQGQEGDRRLQELSDALWREHAYAPEEADRVVLCVELAADSDGETLWHQAFLLDVTGDERGSAMARLVSLPVSFAVNAITAGKIEPGVSAGPTEPELITAWFRQLAEYGDPVKHLVLR